MRKLSIFLLRIVLTVAALGFLTVYLFTLAVALTTSGSELIREPWAWYAAIVPIMYASFCLIFAVGLLRQGPSPKLMFLWHIPVIPALVVSFMGIGVWLLFLAALLGLLYWKLNARC